MSCRIFLDSDIILDVFLNRVPFLFHSVQVFRLVQNQLVDGFTSPMIIGNTHYISTKELGKTETLAKLKNFRIFFKILPTNQTHIDSALNSGFPDFEDAIQYFSALDQSIDFIITRNKKDFGKSIIPVMTAEEFIHYFKSISRN